MVKKSKQSVFTDAHTKYLLLHTSGESIELSGYGQGVDTQDKGAGKATTYALKNAEVDGKHKKMRKLLDWFSKNFTDEYYTLLD